MALFAACAQHKSREKKHLVLNSSTLTAMHVDESMRAILTIRLRNHYETLVTKIIHPRNCTLHRHTFDLLPIN